MSATTADAHFALRSSVSPGAADLRLVASGSGATLETRLRGRAAARLAIFHGGLRWADFTLREGAPARVVVPAGGIRLRLHGEGRALERELRLAAGDSRHVDFVLAP